MEVSRLGVPGVWLEESIRKQGAEVNQLALAAPVRSITFGRRRNGDHSTLPDLLYVGAGPHLSVYSLPSGQLLVRLPFAMPPSGSIYDIKLYKDNGRTRVLLFGQKRVVIIEQHEGEEGSISLNVATSMEMKDWLWDVAPLPRALYHLCRKPAEGKKEKEKEGSDDVKQSKDTGEGLGKYLVFGYAHNFIEVWNWKKRVLVHTLKSEPCILYCLAFHYQRPQDKESKTGRFLIASGTVFNKVLIWDIFGEGKPLYSLIGHQGVIFKVKWHNNGNALCSVSDDRKVSVWYLEGEAPKADTLKQQGGAILPKRKQRPQKKNKGTPTPTAMASQPSEGSIDRRELNSDGSIIIRPSMSAFGHSARIWDCQFIADRYITSVSEDATCRIWDIVNGAPLAVLKGHQGKNAWCVAIDSTNSVIATGGGDGAVRLWMVEDAIEHHMGGKKRVLDMPSQAVGLPTELMTALPKDFSRRIALLGRHQLIIATDKGIVHKCKLNMEGPIEWEYLYHNTAGGVYESMAISPDQQFVALGTTNGDVSIINTEKRFPSVQWKAHEGKVASIFWPEAAHALFGKHSAFFTAGMTDGKLKLWRYIHTDESGFNVQLHTCYSLNTAASITSLDVCATTEIVDGSKANCCHIFCGDSKGSVHVLPTFREAPTNDEEIPATMSLIGIHGAEKVTDIVCRTPHDIYSVCNGRKGSMKRYHWNPAQRVLQPIGLYKLRKMLEGIERILLPRSSDRADRILLSDPIQDTELYSKEKEKEKQEKEKKDKEEEEEIPSDIYLFGFHSEDIVIMNVKSRSQCLSIFCGRSRKGFDFAYDSSPDGKFSLVFTLAKKLVVHSSSPSEGIMHHLTIGTNDIGHGLEINTLTTMASSSSKDKYFITGSSDTTCKIWKVNRIGEPRLTCMQSMRAHSSTVRTITLPENYDTARPMIWFSGGGDCALQCWQMDDAERMLSHPVASYMPGKSRCRVMAVQVVDISNAGGKHVVIAGNSDGRIEVLGYSESMRKFHPLGLLQGFDSAVLSIEHIPMHIQCGDASHAIRHIILLGGTDGRIRFWDASSIIDRYARGEECLSTVPSLEPFHELRAHQAGVNSVSVREIEGGAYALFSGGDDEALCMYSFFLAVEKDTGRTVFTQRGHWLHPLAHASSIQEVVSDGHYVFTTGPDQRLNIWKRQEEKQLQLYASCMISIADAACMDIDTNRNGCYTVFIAGAGIEILEVVVQKC